MVLRKYPPRFAVIFGGVGGGLAGLFIFIQQSERKAHFPLSPLTAVLGGAALGVIAVQILWIRDLLKPGEHQAGSMVFPRVTNSENLDTPSGLGAEDPESHRTPSRRGAGAFFAVGLALLGLNHAMAVVFQRIYPMMTVAGTFLALFGLIGLFDPRLLAARNRFASNKPSESVEVFSPRMVLGATLLIIVGVGIAISIWKVVY
jgi:hypothetical protein